MKQQAAPTRPRPEPPDTNRPVAARCDSPGPDDEAFDRHEYSDNLCRGFFTLFLDDEQGSHISQVWATTPGAAATLMAPWSKDRLRRRPHRPDALPVELVGWDFPHSADALSAESGIPEDELDEGCLGIELCHVWQAERKVEGKTRTLYVIETIPPGEGMIDEDY